MKVTSRKDRGLTLPDWSPVPGSLVQAHRAYWIDNSHVAGDQFYDPELRHKVGVVIGIIDPKDIIVPGGVALPQYVVFWTGPNVGERVTFEVEHRLREVGDCR